MARAVWISAAASVLILGAGAAAAGWIHAEVPGRLEGGPRLAAEQPEAADKAEAPAVQSKSRKEIIEEAQKRVVTIETGSGQGSGFLYNGQGDLLTNAHVVAGWEKVTVRTLSNNEYEGTVIGIGTDTDVAVVRVPALKSLEPLPVARSHRAETGDEVLALGSPLGLQNTVTTGIISGVGRSFDIEPYHYSNLYQISAPITSGNSGGPLVDAGTGEVLGINSAAVTEGAGIGFSIPIVSVIKQAEAWSEEPLSELPGMYGTDTGEDSPDLSADSRDLVSYFYESLNLGDYVTAYSLLGSEWQSGTRYEDFRAGYLHTGSVEVGEVSADQADNDTVRVEAVISAEERRGGAVIQQRYRVTYSVGYENGQLKILHGKGVKID